MSDTESNLPRVAALPVSAILVLGGLGIELVSILRTTPATFLLFVGLGAPLIAAGAGLFLLNVWRALVRKGAV